MSDGESGNAGSSPGEPREERNLGLRWAVFGATLVLLCGIGFGVLFAGGWLGGSDPSLRAPERSMLRDLEFVDPRDCSSDDTPLAGGAFAAASCEDFGVETSYVQFRDSADALEVYRRLLDASDSRGTPPRAGCPGTTEFVANCEGSWTDTFCEIPGRVFSISDADEGSATITFVNPNARIVGRASVSDRSLADQEKELIEKWADGRISGELPVVDAPYC